MTEELTAQDEIDLASLGDSEAPKRVLLETWDKLLDSIEGSRQERVGPAVALKIVSTWGMIEMRDVSVYFDYYHDYLVGYRDDLREVLRLHPDALEHAEDDLEHNRERYLDLLVAWQTRAKRNEDEWDVDDSHAHLLLPAMTDAMTFIMGQMGLVAHLESIGLELTDDEQLAIIERVKTELEES